MFVVPFFSHRMSNLHLINKFKHFVPYFHILTDKTCQKNIEICLDLCSTMAKMVISSSFLKQSYIKIVFIETKIIWRQNQVWQKVTDGKWSSLMRRLLKIELHLIHPDENFVLKVRYIAKMPQICRKIKLMIVFFSDLGVFPS